MQQATTTPDDIFPGSDDLERAVEALGDEAARGHLAAGRSVYRGDARYPGMLVRLNPDESEQLVYIDQDGEINEVRDLS